MCFCVLLSHCFFGSFPIQSVSPSTKLVSSVFLLPRAHYDTHFSSCPMSFCHHLRCMSSDPDPIPGLWSLMYMSLSISDQRSMYCMWADICNRECRRQVFMDSLKPNALLPLLIRYNLICRIMNILQENRRQERSRKCKSSSLEQLEIGD
jgi:hypothetical protein